MKRSLWLLLAVPGFCYSQYNEFKVHENGLIYSEHTMQQLGAIVDSLNLNFKMCDLAHPYHSYVQGEATVVHIPSAAARKQIQEGIALAAFLKQHSAKSKAQKMWVYKSQYTDWEDNPYIAYSALPSSEDDEPYVYLPDAKANDKVSGWVVSDEGEYAMYLHDLKRTTLPTDYARLVQYVDCMIDTTAEIYFPTAQTREFQQVSPNSNADQFIKWAKDYPGVPEVPDYDFSKLDKSTRDSLFEAFSKVVHRWDSARLSHLDARMRESSLWMNMLQSAAEEGLTAGNSSDELEFYVARYLSKEEALKLMRSRKVVGSCSQDRSPRYHAMNICRYAAETAQWDIFLRSHLDIMNDRFERMSDGNYAWAGRKTYLKELESLDINAVDLLLGTCLRVQDVNDNHYMGSISRIGRALAETEDKDLLESRLLAMIRDPRLDNFNRLLMMYLFDNYTYSLEDEARKASNEARLKSVVVEMPEYVRMAFGTD